MLIARRRACAAPIAAACAARAPQSAAPNVTTFTLANGLEVVVIPDRRAPVVTHMVWYKVGAADEPPGKSGIAHFLEHLMFKGTEKNPAGQFSQTVAAIGGQENAFTSQRLHRLLPARLARASQDADGVRSRPHDRPGAHRRRGAARTARSCSRSRTSASPTIPRARLGEQIEAALYLNHPYGRPVIGWRHEIEKLNRDDALAFYRRFYTPNNAVLVVAGDVTADEVKALAEETYGKVAADAPRSARACGRRSRRRSRRASVTLADPRVAQPSLQRSYLVPSSATAKPGEAEALEVLAHILGQRHDQPALSHAGGGARASRSAPAAGTRASALDATRFGVYGAPKPGVTLPQLEEAIDAVIDERRRQGRHRRRRPSAPRTG